MLHLDRQPFTGNRTLRKHYGVIGPVIGATVVYAISAALISIIPDAHLPISSEGIISIVIAYASACVTATCIILRADYNASKKNDINFYRTNPFRLFGTELDYLVYSFRSSSGTVLNEIIDQIHVNLDREFGIETQREITLIDKDRRLVHTDQRRYLHFELPEMSRGARIAVLVRGSRRDLLRIFEYRIFVRGPVKTGNVLGFILFSPLTLPFWLWTRKRRYANATIGLAELYSASLENNDIIESTLAIQKMLIDDLIELLDKNGVDTGDLRARRNQILTINVFGGQATIGSVVQGVQTQAAQPASKK